MSHLKKFYLFGLPVVFVMSNFFSASSHAQDETEPVGKVKMSEIILLQEWRGPYGGVPPWRSVKTEEFVPAFDAAIALESAEIEAIANNAEPPTFENTIIAMENAGKPLERVNTIFGVHTSNLNVGPIADIETAVAPKLSKHSDSITQNKKLFSRIEAIYESDAFKTMSVAQKRLVEKRYKTFVRRGAKLNDEQKIRLSTINSELASLFAKFGQKVLADEEGPKTVIKDRARLAGLSYSVIDSMEVKAEDEAGQTTWVVTNTRSSMDPVLTYADDRELRETVWRTYYSRGDFGDENDTNATITAILKLRAERALLLGYETHAHWRLEPQMAKTPENTMALMMQVWPKAVARVKEEVRDMQAIADKEGAGITIEPWDYRYYAEKAVSYTHLRAHETVLDLVCRLLLEKKK